MSYYLNLRSVRAYVRNCGVAAFWTLTEELLLPHQDFFSFSAEEYDIFTVLSSCILLPLQKRIHSFTAAHYTQRP